MSDWLLNLPVLWMGALILGAIYVFTAGLYLLITALAVGERARAFKGISPGMLPPLASSLPCLLDSWPRRSGTMPIGRTPRSTGKRARCALPCSSPPGSRASPRRACAISSGATFRTRSPRNGPPWPGGTPR